MDSGSGLKKVESREMKKGLTLIELTITIIMFVILTTVTISVFRVILLSWSSQETRSGIDINIDIEIEKMVRDLREAREIDDDYDDDGTPNDEIRFTIEENGLDVHYIYYFYNEDDSYTPPPAFDQDSYELRKATLSGGIGGTFTYGDGQRIMTDIVPPTQGENPQTDLSIDADNLITIILKVTRGDEIITSKTRIKPKDL